MQKSLDVYRMRRTIASFLSLTTIDKLANLSRLPRSRFISHPRDFRSGTSDNCVASLKIIHHDITRYLTPRAMKRPVSISCNGVAATVNLHFHNGLVSIFRLYNALDLFVDAICIPQADVREKVQEVVSMHKVYHRAT